MLNNTKNKVVAVLVSIFVIISVFFYWNIYVFKIGDTKFYRKDIHLKDEISRLYYPEKTEKTGRKELIKSYSNLEILKNNGYLINEKMVLAEEERINQQTKNPVMLQKIKDLFKGDMDSYRKIYVLPVLVDRAIYYDFFTNNLTLQNDSLQRANDFISQVESKGGNLEDEAKKSNLNIGRIIIDEKKGLIQADNNFKPVQMDAPQMTMPAGMPESQFPSDMDGRLSMPKRKVKNNADPTAEEWNNTVLRYLKEGQIAPKPVNSEESWFVIKLNKIERKNPYHYRVEVVSVPKNNFFEWRENEAKKVPLKTFFDFQ